MTIRLPVLVGSIAFAFTFALSAAPAQAAETRVGTLTLTCDGTLRHEQFTAEGLGVSTNRFVQGAEVVAVDQKGKIDYLQVRVAGNENQQLLSLGPKETHASVAFISSLFQTPTDASGGVLFTVDAQCRKGPDITVFVTILYFS